MLRKICLERRTMSETALLILEINMGRLIPILIKL